MDIINEDVGVVIKTESVYDLSFINDSWFKDIFDVITEDETNGEEATGIVVKPLFKNNATDKSYAVIIEFEIDCGRYGTWGLSTVKIDETGTIKINICDSPVEGAIEDSLKNSLLYELQHMNKLFNKQK